MLLFWQVSVMSRLLDLRPEGAAKLWISVNSSEFPDHTCYTLLHAFVSAASSTFPHLPFPPLLTSLIHQTILLT